MPANLFNGLNVIGAVGTSCKRIQLGEVNVYFLIVNCVGVCGQSERNPLLCPEP